jgi:signal transduction histidine kinase
MNGSASPIVIESIRLREIAEALRRTRIFAGTDLIEVMPGVESVERVKARAGAAILETEQDWEHYWVVLEGETRAERPEQDGSWTLVGCAKPGDGFGEVPLLTGRLRSHFRIMAARDSVLVRLCEQEFWTLMACCPAVRRVVLADMAQRLQSHQVEALHREKLVSLGTMAAGLMHELHNPGSAAKRAASQMRENLLRLQQFSLRESAQARTPEQLACMRSLLEHTLARCGGAAMSSMEQADAEEAMGEWLSSAGVENAFAIAPALVSAGLNQEELTCARSAFDASSFSDAINWLEALIASASQVCMLEESVTRISDLVMAVKKFAYYDRSTGKEVDVHDSLQSTLTILGHKLRVKNISVEKRFDASPSKIILRGAALSQVWTNLIDNAADASPEGGKIEVATWSEPGVLGVSVEDHGSGISPEVLPRIFDPFFTTKPQGTGTGLGLEIVKRIITQNFGGSVDVESKPGSTKFLVRLPLDASVGSTAAIPQGSSAQKPETAR